MENLLKKYKLEAYTKEIMSLSKNAILIDTETTDEEDIEIGASKFGGMPDLPKNIKIPRWNNKSLSFLAQLNLSEIKEFDIDNLLPETGFLYFFYDQEQSTWGFDPEDKGSFKVIYADVSDDNLRRAKPPKDLEVIFESCVLSYENKKNIPPYSSLYISNLKLEESEQDSYFELEENVNLTGVDNKIFGYPNLIQGDIQYNCPLVTNGLYLGDSEGYSDPKVEEYLKEYDNWILLLQIDSDDNAEMMWGDLGRIYFYIKKEDLKNRNFDNVWFVLQCS